jgi:hypothetical protein
MKIVLPLALVGSLLGCKHTIEDACKVQCDCFAKGCEQAEYDSCLNSLEGRKQSATQAHCEEEFDDEIACKGGYECGRGTGEGGVWCGDEEAAVDACICEYKAYLGGC